ncbi:MAG: hypothetical protein JOZ52_14345 [Acidobacteria bacterium]|nr:hypothetical protein [Acidobacteriota bacterium]
MNDMNRRRLERLGRVETYGTDNASSFPPDSKGGKAIASIRAIIAEIETLDASRNTGASKARQGTGIKRDKRRSLRARVSTICRTTKTIALDEPEFKDKFRLPGKSISDQVLLSFARSIRAEAEPFKAKFIEYDMPADFLSSLDEELADFESAITQQNSGVGARASALSAIDAALDRAEDEIERLDTIIRNKFANDPAKLAAWEVAKRLERAPRGKSAVSKPPAAPAP